jgi:hypothetical protein
MARGWGRSEEDLGSDKEQAREELAAAARRSTDDTALQARRRVVELSLARIAEQLAATTSPVRRQALEAAREELQAELTARKGKPPAGGGS